MAARPVWIFLMVLLASGPARAYSQFTHEELIDLTWSDTIRPLLLQRYPGVSDEALRIAHAYAYGGCLIQDIGYYPFGERLFSDLAHYVRSGDFVTTLLRDAVNLNELAFAIGALSHYVGDSVGHSEAVNPSTGITFPDLRAKYGPIVTYEEEPTAHVRTEFGFDVAQTAWARYAAGRYRERIGFRVSRVLLYRAFHDTYGLRTRGILGPARSAIPSYRWSARWLLPVFLRAQMARLEPRLPAETPNQAHDRYLEEIARSEYVALGMASHAKPGIRAHLVAALITIIPKIGVLKILAVKAPSGATEDLFVTSAADAIDRFRQGLRVLESSAAMDWRLPNLDLDTGSPAEPGVSKVADDAHVKLLLRIPAAEGPVPVEVRQYLLSYFATPDRIASLRADPRKLQKAQTAIDWLRRMNSDPSRSPD